MKNTIIKINKITVSKYAFIYTVVGGVLIVIALLSNLITPPNISPEFSGSAVIHLSFHAAKDHQEVTQALESLPYAISAEQKTNVDYTFTAKALSDTEYIGLTNHVRDTVGIYTITEYQSFSPSISQELIRKSIIALIAAMIIIIGYITFTFKGVSRPVESWKYGVVATIALMHDVIIPLGVFAVLSSFTSATIDTLFVTALLATLGYSINDTIIIFDRIRDRLTANKERKNKESFEEVIDYGVRNSLRRSIYTSISTAIPLALLFVFVPVTQWFAVALFIGIIAGTYSSLFLAPSLILLWHKLFPQSSKAHKEISDTEKAEDALRSTLRGKDTL